MCLNFFSRNSACFRYVKWIIISHDKKKYCVITQPESSHQLLYLTLHITEKKTKKPSASWAILTSSFEKSPCQEHWGKDCVKAAGMLLAGSFVSASTRLVRACVVPANLRVNLSMYLWRWVPCDAKCMDGLSDRRMYRSTQTDQTKSKNPQSE